MLECVVKKKKVVRAAAECPPVTGHKSSFLGVHSGVKTWSARTA